MDDIAHAPTSEGDLLDALQRSSSAPQIWVERRRYGKEVTVIEGLADVERIAKTLKQRLAVGGTIKEGRVELQGDQRARARAVLKELGFDNATT